MKLATLCTLSSLALVASSSLAHAQGVVDPDPEIFDGTKTKVEAIAQQQPTTTIDNWEEGPNMVVYDTNGKVAQQMQGEGSGGGGAGGGLPGLPGQGGMSPLPGLPGLPGLGSGAAPAIGSPSLQIPTGEQQAAGTQGNPSAPSTPGAAGQQGNTAGAAQSASRPSDVQIGDASQRIKTTAQGQAGNVPGAPEPGETGSKEAGEDSTNVPSGSSKPQSGTRGGGVEQGDAMDPDQI
jgi:hypothetical protein